MKVVQLPNTSSDNYIQSVVENFKKEVDAIQDPGEEWRPIGDSRRNFVSNFGRVKSYPYSYVDSLGRPRVCTGGLRSVGHDLHGYPIVQLEDFETSFVHRMVATAFIPNPENKPFINHKDFNPKNNHVENLEWCTQYENIHYSIDAGRKYWSWDQINAMVAANVKVCSVPVICLETMEEYSSKRVASEQCRVSIMSINYSIKHKVCIKKSMTFVEKRQIDDDFDRDSYLETAYENAKKRSNNNIYKHKGTLPVRRTDTGEVFISLNDAYRKLKMNPEKISISAKTHTPYKGIQFEYVER